MILFPFRRDECPLSAYFAEKLNSMSEIFSLTEIVGYLACAGVIVSFLMKEIKTLRTVNTVGCLLFVVYGVLLNYSLPIIITNVTIVVVNIYYLLKSKQE